MLLDFTSSNILISPLNPWLDFKSHQFGELPTEVVTKISLVSVSELDLQLLNNTRVLVDPDVACHPVITIQQNLARSYGISQKLLQNSMYFVLDL